MFPNGNELVHVDMAPNCEMSPNPDVSAQFAFVLYLKLVSLTLHTQQNETNIDLLKTTAASLMFKPSITLRKWVGQRRSTVR